jgi:hypothetical protein
MTDFPLDRTNQRAFTCFACHARRRELYWEQKGEPVSQERRVRRFTRAQRTVEKALQARIYRERTRKYYREQRQEWEKGDPNMLVNRREIESFMLKDEFWLGPLNEDDFKALKEMWKSRDQEPEGLKEFREALYKKEEYKWFIKAGLRDPFRQWDGYTDPQEESSREESYDPGRRWKGWEDGGRTGLQEGSTGLHKGREESSREESREDTWEETWDDGLRAREESQEESWEGSTGLQESWDESSRIREESWEGSTGLQGSASVRGESTGPQESLQSSASVRGESTGPQESLQDQYCSSCNQKKPLIDFGRFLTCNNCRKRNVKAKKKIRSKNKEN